MTTHSLHESATAQAGAVLSFGHLRDLMQHNTLSASSLLGGHKVLGRKWPQRNADALTWALLLEHEGMPDASLDAFALCFTFAQSDFLSRIGLSPRSVQRRRKEGVKVLDVDAAARAVALANVVARAVDEMGSPEAADRWLTTPNPSLGGEKPLDLAGKPLGSQAVLDVLNAIHHGMFG